MSVKVKIKTTLKGKDAMSFKSLAQEGYMHAHPEILGKSGLKEWDSATKGKHLPKRVKQNRKPNYVSVDELHLPSGSNSNKQKGSERLPDSTQDPNRLLEDRSLEHNPTTAQYVAHAFPPVQDDQVKVSWDALNLPPTVGGPYEKLPKDHPEVLRQKLNRARDARCNLGRGKRGTFVE